MKSKINSSIFYHIYPLGMCSVAKQNDFCSPSGNGINQLCGELEKIKNLGANAIYIGPLFESSSHGYDTVDYYYIDRRLGTNEDFKNFVQRSHQLGISVIVDAVFNHTGRDFFAFKDLQQNGWNSKYKDWYKNIRFDGKSSYGDNFYYEGWAGCMDLVKLNVDNAEVQQHIFGAVEKWINEFDIDGLRLDAADVLSGNFMDNLQKFCSLKKSDFWLMGEVVHGDYNNWAKNGRLDSVTNYELYKGMWSSFNDKNFFEVAYSLNRQFGDGGIYKYAPLYNFVDNHDVNRIASVVKDSRDLVPLYGLLFTVPGIPSIYYGSEWGIRGMRNNCGDYELRPAIYPFAEKLPDWAVPQVDGGILENAIRDFARIKKENAPLQGGNYKQLVVQNKQFAFMRYANYEDIVVALNCDDVPCEICIEGIACSNWKDLITGEILSCEQMKRLNLNEHSIRILKKM